jgi:hypothetical protein
VTARDPGWGFTLVAAAQTALHFFGWMGVLLGGVAYLFGNSQRGAELAIGGAGMLATKFLIGGVYAAVKRIARPE